MTLVKTTTSADHVSKTQHFCYVFFAMCQKLNAFAMLFLQNVEKPMLLIPFPSFSILSYIFLPFPNFPSLSSAFFFLLPPSSFLFPRFSLAIVIRNMKCMILGPRATCILYCILYWVYYWTYCWTYYWTYSWT